MRSLWEKYYADAHGLIFVMDSADVGRFEEARMAFGEYILEVVAQIHSYLIESSTHSTVLMNEESQLNLNKQATGISSHPASF